MTPQHKRIQDFQEIIFRIAQELRQDYTNKSDKEKAEIQLKIDFKRVKTVV